MHSLSSHILLVKSDALQVCAFQEALTVVIDVYIHCACVACAVIFR